MSLEIAKMFVFSSLQALQKVEVEKSYILEQLDLPGDNIYILRTPNFAREKITSHLIFPVSITTYNRNSF